jgi:hypothetical protein
MNKEVQKVKMGTLDKGNHRIILQLNTMPSGLYFYSLYIDEIRNDVKKMLKK